MKVQTHPQYFVSKIITSAIICAASLSFTACEKLKPDSEVAPDMYESTSFKAQKEDPHSPDGAAARMPPEGTVSRNFKPYHYEASDTEKACKELKNPLEKNEIHVARGKKTFNTYCIVCHGAKGDGQGSVVPPFPRPPSLLSEKVRTWADGCIYNVITKGQGLMPTYALQVAPNDRWAVIHYIRELQKAADAEAKEGRN